MFGIIFFLNLIEKKLGVFLEFKIKYISITKFLELCYTKFILFVTDFPSRVIFTYACLDRHDILDHELNIREINVRIL